MQRPARASFDDMTRFHSDDYISFLQRINPDKAHEFMHDMTRCALSEPMCECRELVVIVLAGC